MTRAQMMSRVRSKNTLPELRVRKAAHGLGYRFRLHRRDLPGSPDLCFPAWRTVIFVHGCFWHQHEGCSRAGRPKTRPEFWDAKLDRNIRRDADAVARLEADGWNVGIIWECETNSRPDLEARLTGILGCRPLSGGRLDAAVF
ncbi:very short patch repair endonuclease [Brevundimonas diminuta]|uniref:very short patch repair endonuclease n=1 Tax=Brevundimonas diminuta TaxID=293 RepID=UPI003D9A9A0F